ncbi:unnamed protein product [Penicillium palitans]
MDPVLVCCNPRLIGVLKNWLILWGQTDEPDRQEGGGWGGCILVGKMLVGLHQDVVSKETDRTTSLHYPGPRFSFGHAGSVHAEKALESWSVV